MINENTLFNRELIEKEWNGRLFEDSNVEFKNKGSELWCTKCTVKFVWDELDYRIKKEPKMTKCTVIGENEPIKKELKKIEFINYLDAFVSIKNCKVEKADTKPGQYANIELISGDISGIDIMFAFDKYRSKGHIYLGYWNDGIV